MNFYEYMNESWFMAFLSLMCITIAWCVFVGACINVFNNFLSHRRQMKALKIKELEIKQKGNE